MIFQTLIFFVFYILNIESKKTKADLEKITSKVFLFLLISSYFSLFLVIS